MAVTLHKAFQGFFDGRKTLNLTRLEDEDGGYIIFLDEFDFLENDLVGLICRAPQISNPFRVVELFYRAMTIINCRPRTTRGRTVSATVLKPSKELSTTCRSRTTSVSPPSISSPAPSRSGSPP